MDNNKPKYLKSFRIVDNIPFEYYEKKFGPWPKSSIFKKVTLESKNDDIIIK